MAFIFLLPSAVTSYYKEKELEADVAANSLLPQTTQTSEANIVVSTNAILKELNSNLQYPLVKPLLDAILSYKTSDIYVTGFSYASKDAVTADITLSGVSNNREALVSFVKSLKNSGLFSAVNLPVSDLAKDSAIGFSISINFAQKQ